MKHRMNGRVRAGLAAVVTVSMLQITAAQDRLKTMPGYEQYQKISREMPGAVGSGALSVTWKDATTFEYPRNGKQYRYDVTTKAVVEVGGAPAAAGGGRGGRGGQGIERGRQAASADSPDQKLKAFYRDRNLWLSDANGGGETQITTDGSEKDRIKYGTASWVYGEELGQNTAMWWSPDGKKLAYYRFDEKQVPDYFLQLSQTAIQSTMDVEAYPKAGAPNPVVDLFVYDVAAKKTTRVDVRSGQPFDNSAVGHYVYRVAWSPDGRELLFNRTNRRQQILEFAAANPETGATRAIIREEWPTGWVENSPAIHWLEDGRRFVWQSERNGWKNLYLYDLSGKLLAPITAHTTFEVGAVAKIDERAGVLFYTARDGDNHLKMQLHRVGLDGRGDVRLTDPAFNHTVAGCMPGGGAGRGGGAPGAAGGCGISPDNKYFVDVYQTHNTPPATRLVDAATRNSGRRARAKRPDEVQPARVEKGGDLHLQGSRREDDPPRDDPVPVELRSVAQVSCACQRVWRSGFDGNARELRHPQSSDRVWIPDPLARLPLGAGAGQADARCGLSEARAGGDGRHGRGDQGAVEPGRISTRTASGSTGLPTAVTRPPCRCCATRRSMPRPPHRLR